MKIKIIVPFRSVPTQRVRENSKKIAKKIQKIKKYNCGFISTKNRLQKAKKIVKIKIIVPFRSNPTRNRKFQKNSKKIKKIALWLHFKPK